MIFGTLVAAGANECAAANSAGATLRSYLTARLAGDTETASGLWERTEMRRALAMGMRYEQVEASFDDYWLMSEAERKRFAAEHKLVVTDSTDKKDGFEFTVAVQRQGEVVDRWRYRVFAADNGFAIASNLESATSSWTERESKYVRLRSQRLSRTNDDALRSMDAHIESLFVAFATPKAAQLRLERVRYQIYLYDEPAQLEILLGSRHRHGYLPASERIVTNQVADFAALTEAVATLTLRKTAPAGPAFFTDGLSMAFGGQGVAAADVLLQRTRSAVLNGTLAIDLPFTQPDAETALAVRALWNRALLSLLGADKYFALYNSMRGTPQSVRNTPATDIRTAVEKATGKKGKSLDNAVRDFAQGMTGSIVAGCERWPTDIPYLESILEWRDAESTWGMKGYSMGSEFVFAVGGFASGLPKWAYDRADSISRASGHGALGLDRAADPDRPSGDPPYFVVVFAPRYDSGAQPYTSQLYEEMFAEKEYYGELLGFFVSYDLVRVYDYRIERLVAEYSAADAPRSAAVLYDEEAGRMCFRIRKAVFPKSIEQYLPRADRYTGQ